MKKGLKSTVDLGHANPAITLGLYAETSMNAKRVVAGMLDKCLGWDMPASPTAVKVPSAAVGELSVAELEVLLTAAKIREAHGL